MVVSAPPVVDVVVSPDPPVLDSEDEPVSPVGGPEPEDDASPDPDYVAEGVGVADGPALPGSVSVVDPEASAPSVVTPEVSSPQPSASAHRSNYS